MKPHEQILKLIKEVDQNDKTKLFKINGMVSCYIKKIDPLMEIKSARPYPMWKDSTAQRVEYTNSRDALKEIRLKNYVLKIETCTDEWACAELSGIDNAVNFETPVLPTEELAELHAIIQAIQYERGLNE